MIYIYPAVIQYPQDQDKHLKIIIPDFPEISIHAKSEIEGIASLRSKVESRLESLTDKGYDIPIPTSLTTANYKFQEEFKNKNIVWAFYTLEIDTLPFSGKTEKFNVTLKRNTVRKIDESLEKNNYFKSRSDYIDQACIKYLPYIDHLENLFTKGSDLQGDILSKSINLRYKPSSFEINKAFAMHHISQSYCTEVKFFVSPKAPTHGFSHLDGPVQALPLITMVLKINLEGLGEFSIICDGPFLSAVGKENLSIFKELVIYAMQHTNVKYSEIPVPFTSQFIPDDALNLLNLYIFKEVLDIDKLIGTIFTLSMR